MDEVDRHVPVPVIRASVALAGGPAVRPYRRCRANGMMIGR